jgi:hypothetical protein
MKSESLHATVDRDRRSLWSKPPGSCTWLHPRFRIATSLVSCSKSILLGFYLLGGRGSGVLGFLVVGEIVGAEVTLAC